MTKRIWKSDQHHLLIITEMQIKTAMSSHLPCIQIMNMGEKTTSVDEDMKKLET